MFNIRDMYRQREAMLRRCGPGSRRRPRTSTAVVLVLAVETLSLAIVLGLERPLAYNIAEERPSGTVVVADLPKDAGLTTRYTPGVLRTLSYVILAQSQLRDYFQLEERSGKLKTARVIDRDVICRQQWSCVVRLDVAVHPAR